MNFVPEERRVGILRKIHRRLKKGAPFLIIDDCSDKGSRCFEDDLRIYAAFARRNGAPADVVEKEVSMQRERLYYVLPEREVAMLSEAGFAMRGCFMRA